MIEVKNKNGKKIGGWKIAGGDDVYIEDGKVLRGIKLDHNGYQVTAYPYRQSKSGGWDLISGISLAAFRAGIRRGTMKLM